MDEKTQQSQAITGRVHLLKLPNGHYKVINNRDAWEAPECYYMGLYNIVGGTGEIFIDYLKKQTGTNSNEFTITQEQFESHVEKFNTTEQ